MKQFFQFCFCLLALSSVSSQEKLAIKDSLSYDGANFKSVNEYYIYGDSKAIGNTILSEHKSRDYNDLNSVNDDIKMKYIDIDDDKSTFSSSAAKLKLPDNLKKITYAGLYWSATYSLEEGKRRKVKDSYEYKGDFRQETAIDTIKLKTPNGEYQTISGEIIYDGATNPTHAINSPYVCYADVTNILKNAPEQNGYYTVANVKASRGYISGGSAAGWMLYIIYQSPTDNPKYISTYNGFGLVNNLPVDINFKNFKSIDQGDVKTSLTVSALEGDITLLQDECAIVTKNGKFQSLSNGARYQQNFFNSSITSNSIINSDRIPASRNTLGFDIAELEIPNYNNEIIDNNTSETTLRLKTKSDRFYLYFAAFQTEISQDFFKDIVEDQQPVSNVSKIEPETIRTTVEEVKKTKPKYVWKPPGKLGFGSRAYKYTISKPSTIITDVPSGYYVISNVFSGKNRARKWERYLIKKGYTPFTFTNPKNNWEYVAVLKTEDSKKAFIKQQEMVQEYRFRDTWILKVNLD
ncbi:hypothetical protein [Lacinutrix sp. 5H-3-7-4]|uniref:hypothetical protein n=1 Tax=Lacinutrix sp. (strain 5H-3-7-4) TaxID=983544 RepID=UPI00020A37EA|nr:hypothetical protein [Lacinutrix sp. 5H-3-7-4]AEH00864.1 putative adhesin precursor SprB [Lacinutrix sp. 5H-3-7-4]